MNSIKILIN